MVLVKAFEVTMQSFMALALNIISTALEIRHAAWKCIHTELGHPRPAPPGFGPEITSAVGNGNAKRSRAEQVSGLGLACT